jgi:type II secretory pathway component PulF
MSLFIYEGVTKSGEKVTGKFFGTYDELIKELKREGILLTNIKEEEKKQKKGKFTNEDFSNTIEELDYLISSGVQLDKAISILVKNASKISVAEFWERVLKKLKEGKTLSTALKETGKEKEFPIPEFYINIISVGEEIGNLHSAFSDIIEDIRFRENLKKEIKSATAYPAFLLIVAVLTVFFVSGFILPKFSEIFTEKELEKLPSISKITLDFGKFVNQNMDIILMGALIILTVIIYGFTSGYFAKNLSKIVYSIPVIKNIALKIELANIFSSLGTMLEGGVEISRALKLSSKIARNKTLENILNETVSEIKKGKRISNVWARYDIIPDNVISIVAVAEQSAKLGEVFKNLGKRYMDSFKNDVSRILTFLEPAIIVILGFFVAFIVVAIMLAVVSVSDIYG